MHPKKFMFSNTNNYGKLYLYNRGDLCTDVTGGWATPTYTSSGWTIGLTFGSDYISYRGSSGSLFELRTNNTFAIENYSKLVVVREYKTNGTGNNVLGYHGFGFCSNAYTIAVFPNAENDRGEVWVTKDEPNNYSVEEVDMTYAEKCLVQTLYLNSSNITGNYYIFVVGGHSGSSEYGKIHEIYLE